MTNSENVNGQDDVLDRKQKKHDSGAADLERVTDWTEEREISKDISNVNNSERFFWAKLTHESLFPFQAVNLFADKRNKENEEKLAKEHELQKIQVKREHLELIMSELEVSANVAEKALRENKGDVVLALRALIA